MSIKEQIQKDRISALKAGEKERKALLDYILGEIQKAEKDPHAKGDPAIAMIQAYLKSQREMAKEFAESRPEETARIQREVEILSQYMPRQLSDDEVRQEIRILVDQGVTGKGPIMAALKQKHGAALDGKRAAELAGEMAG